MPKLAAANDEAEGAEAGRPHRTVQRHSSPHITNTHLTFNRTLHTPKSAPVSSKESARSPFSLPNHPKMGTKAQFCFERAANGRKHCVKMKKSI